MNVEGVVDENPRKARIRIDLTRRQRAQIRSATGRDVSALDLGLERLPGPATPSPPSPRVPRVSLPHPLVYTGTQIATRWPALAYPPGTTFTLDVTATYLVGQTRLETHIDRYV